MRRLEEDDMGALSTTQYILQLRVQLGNIGGGGVARKNLRKA